MRVLLIHPKLQRNFYGEVRLPPMGLAYVAAALRNAGHDVSLCDANLSPEPMATVKEAFFAFQPDMVGLTAPTSLMRVDLDICKQIKAWRPEVHTVLGGVHPTIFPKEVAERPHVDFAVHGEGEETIVALCAALEGGGRPTDVAGVAWHDGEEVVANPKRPAPGGKDLDYLPMPAYDLLPINAYSGPQIAYQPFVSMITSRGCPYPCTFCDAYVVSGRGFRFHSPERTVEELKYLKRTFGIREVMFKDSEFTLRKERVVALCELMIKEGLDIKWSCNSRVSRVDVEFLTIMKAGGCRLIQFGVESGDDEMLKAIKKKITVDEVREAFQAAREVGVETVANFMIGHPGETREDVEKTIALVKDINPNFGNFSFAIPFPGTELYRQAVANGWLLENYDAFDLKISDCVMNATKMSTEELRVMLKRLYRSFYLRPRYIAGRAFSTNPHVWKMNFRGLRQILSM